MGVSGAETRIVYHVGAIPVHSAASHGDMSAHGLILLYHRVADVDSDAWGLCVSPRHFAEQMDVVARHFTAVDFGSIGAAVDRRQAKEPVAVTFDDGYVDNLEAAKAVLSAFGIPATLFVISSAVGRQREFWWEELERILLEPGPLPSELHLTIGGEDFDGNLAADRDYSRAAYNANRAWRALSEETPTARHALFRSIYFALQPLPAEEITAAINSLWVWAGSDGMPRPERLPMNEEQYVRLTADGLIELGAHTATHPLLPAHSAEVQRREIEHSRDKLEESTGKPVRWFSYPYGKYSPKTLGIVQDLGFEAAGTTEGRAVRAGVDSALLLPRWAVEDCDGEDFQRKLSSPPFSM